MNRSWIVGSFSFFAIAASGVVAVEAQAPARPPARERTTVSGCLQRDSAYRPDRPIAGANPEFLLVTRMEPTGARKGEPATFGLIGTAEQQLGRYVGQRIEVVGMLETDSRDQQQPTGGATDPVTGAGTPPGVPASVGTRGTTTPSVRRLEIISFKRVNGSC
jgi:hypothetical protein